MLKPPAKHILFLVLAGFLFGVESAFAQQDKKQLDSLWEHSIKESMYKDPDYVADESSSKTPEADIGSEQIADSLVALSKDYLRAYRCSDAISFLKAAYALCRFDSSKKRVEAELEQCKEKIKLIQNVALVSPVDMHTFSINDFYLYYPLPDNAWRMAGDSSAVFCPGEEKEVYVSKGNSTDEVFAMIDGDRKYFSSKDLPGIGGYDLFYCDWNERQGEWGDPVNMGFPYNSPSDEFLFMNTKDHKYSLFASNRNSSADSITVYVLDYQEELTSQLETDPGLLSQIASLAFVPDLKKVDVHSASGESIQEDNQVMAYQKTTSMIRYLQEQISRCGEQDTALKEELEEKLSSAKKRLEELEENFLANGAYSGNAGAEVEQEVVGADGVFTFTRKNLGPSIKIVYIND